MYPTVSRSTLIPPGQIVETMTDEERLRFGSAYGDLLEVCRHMEIKQGVCRQVVVGALLATVMTLCGNSEDYAEVLEAIKRS